MARACSSTLNFPTATCRRWRKSPPPPRRRNRHLRPPLRDRLPRRSRAAAAATTIQTRVACSEPSGGAPSPVQNPQLTGLHAGGRATMLAAGASALGNPGKAAALEAFVLNRSDRPSPMAGEAEVKYLDGDFRVVRPGAFVRCAVTGLPIPLEDLKYWSVDLQEPYINPEVVLQRHFPERFKR